ncbi:hypothetical protein V1512DRAFT_268371 [Lipomyces arxii]|uniref:uncharacterized protein n=1 Tax=Lipomyces arxii TaxID=56418 RepID=UPI0034CD5D9B
MVNYRLKVSAASGYDAESVADVPVNTDTPIEIDSAGAHSSILVRIQNFAGYPDGSPRTNAYFGYKEHEYDMYAIRFDVTFKADTSFDDVLFGNDFDRPIRDHLPYGFGMAYKIFNYAIDPSATGDVYADKPYLYGYAVTSINTISQDEETEFLKEDMTKIIPVEGDLKIPPIPAGRRKFFLHDPNRTKFVFKAGETYKFDFFNPYIDMGHEFALKLPGYNLGIMKYWDGQPLRYVLKSKSTGKPFFALLFELVPQD